MTRKTIFIMVVLTVNVIVAIGLYNWRVQKQRNADKLLRDATRYAGATGETITAFDERTNRWIAELWEEKIEETLVKLTDAAEYMAGILRAGNGRKSFYNEEWRERAYYRVVAEAVLSNRRFRAAYEGLQKTSKKQAAVLLSKNIRENLAVLRTMLQEDQQKVSRGEHKGMILRHIATESENSYRPMSDPNTPPTHTGRKYAVFSYLLLASFLELREVRSVVEEVVQFAKQEYEFFTAVDAAEALSFKVGLLDQSLYNPSLLVTAAFCDPSWKTAEKRRLPNEKLVEREIVDFQARAVEQDKDARKGWIPVVPHDKTLKIRYYKGVTDAEFDDFFGK